jgi:hypothetical protein
LKNIVCKLACLPAIVVGLALCTTSAQAQVTKVGNAYQFRVKYHKGMKIKYLMKIVTGMPASPSGGKPQSISMEIPVDSTVVDMQNKIATIKVITGPTKLNGQPQGATQSLEMKMNDRGKPISGAPPGMENLTASLPDKPLTVGESYTANQNIAIAQMPITVHALYTFRGVKSVKGREVAVFNVTLNGSGNIPTAQGASAKFTTRGDGSMTISVEDGLANETNIDQVVSVPQGSQVMKVKTKTTLARQ